VSEDRKSVPIQDSEGKTINMGQMPPMDEKNPTDHEKNHIHGTDDADPMT
jgi:hypothetical protein